jgi:uncharacterized protein YijF (DUF1287 family)
MKNSVLVFFVLLHLNCNSFDSNVNNEPNPPKPQIQNKLYNAAVKFSKEENWSYDPAYYRISYPNGDVPSGGACTDVIIRALREQKMDLQQLIHEDMTRSFHAYPRNWGLNSPDANIDHRRVPNIMKFFERKGYSLPVTDNIADYEPGDIVTWQLGGKLTHIGICLENGDVYHNIGPYAKIDKAFLFQYRITGHYRI